MTPYHVRAMFAGLSNIGGDIVLFSGLLLAQRHLVTSNLLTAAQETIRL